MPLSSGRQLRSRIMLGEWMAAVFCLASTFLLGVMSSASAQSPSFDCAKATQPVEQIICGSADLSALDIEMTAAFKRAQDSSGDRRAELLTAQRQWLRERSPTCHLVGGPLPGPDLSAAETCLEQSYHARIVALSQPAATTTKTACDAVADQIRAYSPPANFPEAWGRVVDALSAEPNGSLKVDKNGWVGEKREALTKLSSEFRASEKLIKAVASIAGSGEWFVRFYRSGHRTLYAAEVTRGSSSCQHFVFFDAASNGQAQQVKAPLVVEGGDSTSFCSGATGWIGEAGGESAFIVEHDNGSPNVDIGITPWRNDGWQRECHVGIHFDAELKVTDQFCKNVNCASFCDIAQTLAVKFDRDPKSAASTTLLSNNLQSEKFARMKQLMDADKTGLRAQLPTFGAYAKSSYTGFSGAILFPVVVGGETFLAQLGGAAFGWRESPDYLFAAYRLGDDGLEPVAGIYISKIRSRPTEVVVK